MKNSLFQRIGSFAIASTLGLIFVMESHAQQISTYAGKGGRGYNGDGIPATAALLDKPMCAAVDGSGNVYVADQYTDRIRKISTSGVITTVCGTGIYGFSGDGGPATAAQIGGVSYIAVDASSNLYIADCGSARVRKVTTSGIISTVAGNGSTATSGDGGPATAAGMSVGITGICFDGSGNMYIADGGRARIRMVNSSGIISTFAGTGTAGYGGDGGAATAALINTPYGLCADGSGNIYVADYGDSRIRKINSSGNISTFAGIGSCGYSGDGAAATAAAICRPYGITIDGSGNIYFTDNVNRIRKVNSSGVISTYAGVVSIGYYGDGMPATAASLNAARGISADASGNIYIADCDNARVRKINTSGTISTIAGFGHPGFTGDGGPATSAELFSPAGVSADRAGNVYIADNVNSRIRKVTSSGIISSFASYVPGVFGITTDTSNNVYFTRRTGYVCTATSSGTITVIAGNGTNGFSGDGGPATAAQFSQPNAIAVDAVGNIYINDQFNYRVRKIDPSGVITTFAGTGSAGYSGDGGPATAAQIYATDIAVDPSGNVYLADATRVRVISPAGIISVYAGTGTTAHTGDGGPATAAALYADQITFDRFGNLYIAEKMFADIRKVTPGGIITTIGGSGVAGFLGDGGPATNAQIYNTAGITADANGSVYFSEAGNHIVRRIGNCWPRVSSITGPGVVCIGSTISLSDTVSGGTWHSVNTAIASVNVTTGLVAGVAAGTVTIFYTVSNSCGADTATQTITVNPLPNAGTISGTDSVCPASAVTLTAAVAGGTWRSSNTSIASINPTTGVVTGIAPGSVTISYIVTNICGSDTATYAFRVKSAAGCPSAVGSLQSAVGSLQLFPNPNHGTFSIVLPSESADEAKVTITNIVGQKVREFTLATNKESEVKLSVPAGIYYVTAIVDGTLITGKVVVE